MIKRLYKRFLLWVLSPVLGDFMADVESLESSLRSEIASLQSQVAYLLSR